MHVGMRDELAIGGKWAQIIWNKAIDVVITRNREQLIYHVKDDLTFHDIVVVLLFFFFFFFLRGLRLRLGRLFVFFSSLYWILSR